MSKKIKPLISFLIGTIITIILAYYVGLGKIINIFLHVKLIYIIFFTITSIVIMFLRVIKWRLILESHDIDIPMLDLFMYRLAGFAVSYLTPSAHIGGEPVRAYFVSKKAKVDFNKAFSSVIIDKAIELTLDGFFTVVFTLIVLAFFKIPLAIKLFFYFNLILITFLILLFYVRTINGKGFFTFFFTTLKLGRIKFLKKYEKKVKKIDKTITELFYYSKYYLHLAFLMHFLAWILSLVEFQLILMMFGFRISWINAFMVYAGVGLAYLIPIPGALGILEVIQSFVAQITKLPIQTSFAVSFVVRARDGIWTIIGVLYLYFKGVNFNNLNIKKLKLKNNEK